MHLLSIFEECLELIEKLQNAKWFKAATKAGTHKKLFSKFNLQQSSLVHQPLVHSGRG
jgi:hypothetical protein